MLIVMYRSLFHLSALLKVSLAYLSISHVMAEFSASSPASIPHPVHNLFPSFICLRNLFCVFAYFSIALFAFCSLPPLSGSHLRIALVHVAVRFWSRVNEQRALGCRVDHLSALVLVGVSRSWLTWPARWNHTLSSASPRFISPQLVVISPQCEFRVTKHSPRTAACFLHTLTS